jgi:MOSC domain-containing protein YiiM
MSEIVSIVYKPKGLPDQPSDHYTRVVVQSVALVENYGIEDDRKGGHPKRQVNIMSFETLAELASEGFNIEPGQMGEQIVVKGVNVNTLTEGDRVQLGEATIEVTTPRTGCDRFQALQGKNPADARGRLGVMARVVKGGHIAVGDPVMILQDA